MDNTARTAFLKCLANCARAGVTEHSSLTNCSKWPTVTGIGCSERVRATSAIGQSNACNATPDIMAQAAVADHGAMNLKCTVQDLIVAKIVTVLLQPDFEKFLYRFTHKYRKMHSPKNGYRGRRGSTDSCLQLIELISKVRRTRFMATSACRQWPCFTDAHPDKLTDTASMLCINPERTRSTGPGSYARKVSWRAPAHPHLHPTCVHRPIMLHGMDQQTLQLCKGGRGRMWMWE